MQSSQYKNRIGLALFAGLQNALVGGIVFGWASIDRTMLKASEADGGANLTALETTQLFAYASCTAMMSSLFLGPVLDAYGPRTCLLVSHLLVVLGCGGFALSRHVWQFTLSVMLMAFGGPGIGLGIIHNANLFPQNQFLAVSCLAGSITLSFSMLAILELVWEHWQMSFRILFGSYSVVAAISMTFTLLVSPDEPYELEEDEDSDEEDDLLDSNDFHPSLEQEYIEATIHTYAHHHQHPFLLTDQSLNATLRCERLEEDVDYDEIDSHHMTDHNNMTEEHNHHHHHPRHLFHRSRSFYQSQEAIQSGNEMAVQLMSLKDQPLSVQVQSPTFARAVVIFVITSFLANFTIASLNTELEDVSPFTLDEKHDLSQQFTWLLSLGMPYSVLVGWLMDHVGLEVCTLLTLILGQLSTLLMMVISCSWFPQPHSYSIMVWGFALYSLFRQFLYPVFLAYITARLGFKYFGILSGIGFALSGLAQWFMADLVNFVHQPSTAIHGMTNNNDNGWMEFHIFQIVLMGILMIIPIADHRDIQRREAQMEEALRALATASSGTTATNGGNHSINKSPRSIASTATTATSITPLWRERLQHNNGDLGYGSLVNG